MALAISGRGVGAGTELPRRSAGVVLGVSWCIAGVRVESCSGLGERGTMPRDLSAADIVLAGEPLTPMQWLTQ